MDRRQRTFNEQAQLELPCTTRTSRNCNQRGRELSLSGERKKERERKRKIDRKISARNSKRVKRRNIEGVVNEGRGEKAKGKQDAKLAMSKEKDQERSFGEWKRELDDWQRERG